MAASLSNFFSIGSTYAQGFIRSSSLDSKTKSTVQVTSFKNVRDIDDDAIRHIAEHYSIKSDSKDDEMEYIPSFSIPMTKSVLTDVSPSGLVFTINQSKDNHPILEINSPSVSLKIDAFDHHGKVQGDTWFGGITWSFDERLVVYVSLSKDGKPETYFEKSCKRQKTSAETDGTNKPFPEQSTRVKNEYKEDMGEKFDGVDGMYINVLDTYTGRIVSFWRGESDSIMGCPVFVPSPAGTYYLVYTHWSSFPRRLGAVFCHNRPCTMHLIDVSTFVTATSFQTFKSLIDLDAPEINSVHQRIASVLAIARQVRFTPDEKTAVILGRREFCSSHNYCYELYKCDVITNVDGKLTLSEPVLVVPIVETPQNGSSFPGLFVDSLPVRPFLDSNRIVITSTYLSTDSVVCVDLHTGAVTRLNKAIISSLSHISDDTVTVSNNSWNSLDHASCTVLDVYPVAGELYSGYILCTLSTPLSPQRLGLLAIKKDSSEQDIQSYRGWRSPLQQRYFSVSNKAQLQGTSSSPVTTITQSVDDVDKQLKTMSWKVFEFFATSTQDMSSLTSRPLFDNRFEVIVITPPLTPSDGKEEELPVILVPHGGPHSCTVTQYFPAYAFLCAQLRAIIIHVNYRGSLGFGQSSIDSLPGNIGIFEYIYRC